MLNQKIDYLSAMGIQVWCPRATSIRQASSPLQISNLAADIIFISELDGDEAGQSFTGPAGQLFDQMLLAMGLNRNQVLIINNIKGRPSNHGSEIESLKEQINTVNPKLLVVFGEGLGQTLLNCSLSLTEMRAKEHFLSGLNIPLFVTYSPAYLLINASEKSKAYLDLIQIKAYLDK